MDIISNVLFYGVVGTLVLSLLLALVPDEMSKMFYFVLDTITHQVTSITEFGRR